MSYCVNCGVELDGSLKECPLCNTAVINPKEIATYKKKTSPFPRDKEKVEAVRRKDVGVLVSIILFSTAVTCGALNSFVFMGNYWSVTIIGACILLWVMMFPVIIWQKLNVYFALLFDGIALILYLYLITLLTDSNKWFWGLGIPIVVFVTLLLEGFALCTKNLPKSILTTALYSITTVGVLCVGLELLIDWYLYEKIIFKWSAIAATVCVIIDIAIISLLCMRRLRNEVRKRLHF